jgi:hypothetical protein
MVFGHWSDFPGHGFFVSFSEDDIVAFLLISSALFAF